MTSESTKWGDRDILLTKTEKQEFSEWVNQNKDYTLTSRVFKPIYRLLEKFVPQNLAPNVITLSGFLCVLNGVYLCFRYIDIYPRTVSGMSMILSIFYQILNGIDGIHAEKTGNVSNVGHVFSRFCTGVGALLQTLILSYILDIDDINIQWHFVQIVMIVVFLIHLNGYHTGVVIILFRVLGFLSFVYDFYFFNFFPYINSILKIDSYQVINGIRYEDSILFFIYVLRFVYYLLLFITLFGILRLGRKQNEGKDVIPQDRQRNTRNSLIIVVLIRMIPGILIYFNLYTEMELLDIVSDGLFMCMVTFELIVSKMCKKDLHPWVIMFAVASLMNHILIYFMVLFHFVAITFEVATYLNLPVFSINRNVYIDGVYDMCHYGHFKYFERALKEGTRLFVGVCSDEDVMGYKRKPIMNTEERCSVIATCKSVYKVIPNCPMRVSAELIEKYNIHCVLCSVEYDNPKDLYYTEARKRGILKPMGRTEGMSTSELIRRIQRKYKSQMKEEYPYIFDEKGEIRTERSLSPVPSLENLDEKGLENGKNSGMVKKEEEDEDSKEIKEEIVLEDVKIEN